MAADVERVPPGFRCVPATPAARRGAGRGGVGGGGGRWVVGSGEGMAGRRSRQRKALPALVSASDAVKIPSDAVNIWQGRAEYLAGTR